MENDGHSQPPEHVIPGGFVSCEYLPEMQSVHVPGPADALTFPATHCVHNPPLDPDEPGLQVQEVKAELPAGESELDGHPMQALVPVPGLKAPAQHNIIVMFWYVIDYS